MLGPGDSDYPAWASSRPSLSLQGLAAGSFSDSRRSARPARPATFPPPSAVGASHRTPAEFSAIPDRQQLPLAACSGRLDSSTVRHDRQPITADRSRRSSLRQRRGTRAPRARAPAGLRGVTLDDREAADRARSRRAAPGGARCPAQAAEVRDVDRLSVAQAGVEVVSVAKLLQT